MTIPRKSTAVLGIAATIAALGTMAVVNWHAPSAHGVPTASFSFGPADEPVEPFDEVPMFDAMRLRLELPFDAYVYVVGFDYDRGTVTYYPSEFLATDHEDAEGTMHRFAAGTVDLPGRLDDRSLAWFVPDVRGALSLCVIVSPKRLEELEKQVTMTRQVGNTAFASRVMGDYMPRVGRRNRIGRQTLPHPILVAAQNQLDAIEPGPMVACSGRPDVFVDVLNIRPGPPRAGVQSPGNPFADALRKSK